MGRKEARQGFVGGEGGWPLGGFKLSTVRHQWRDQVQGFEGGKGSVICVVGLTVKDRG